MNKKDYIVALVLIAIFTFILLFSIKKDELTIFPFPSPTEIEINTSHESIDSGFSKGAYTLEKNGALQFRYTLAKNLQEPIAAVYFHKPSSQNRYFDFSSFNELSIELSTAKGKRIPVYLTIDYQNLKTKQKELLSMPLLQVIHYSGPKTYTLLKNNFEIPSWWLRYHELTKESIGEIDYSKVNYILVNSCQALGPEQEDVITIKRLAFTQNNYFYYLAYAVLVTCSVLVLFLKNLFKKPKKVLVPYKTSEIDLNPNGTKVERIVRYIGQNYPNPELGIYDIQKALGISSREIGTIFKDELNTSFKAYLNIIRLQELKRMLLETDLPISDIAYKMGYGNISHFNRVFKKELGVSPKEFRDTKENKMP